MLIVIRRRGGALSLLLIVIILPLLLVFATGLQIARRLNDEAGLARAMRQQLSASIARFDPDMYQQFGLLGIRQDSWSTAVFQATVPQRFAAAPVEMTVAADLHDPAILAGQIGRTMKLRLPILWLDQIYRLSGLQRPPSIAEPGQLDPAMAAWTRDLGQIEEPAGLLEDALAPEIFSRLEDLVRESLDQVSETDKLEILEQALDWMDDLNDHQDILSAWPDSSGWIQGVSGWLDDLATGPQPAWVQKAGLAEYCLAYLTSAVTVRQSRDGQSEPLLTISGLALPDLAKTRPAEIEQIISGHQDPAKARRSLKTGLTALRSAIQLTAILADPDDLAILRAEAVALVSILAAATGILLEPESITYLLAISQAILRGVQEVNSLLAGQSIRLFPENLLDQPLVLSYADHLRLLLLTLPTDTLLLRISQCVQKTFPQPYAAALKITVRPVTGPGRPATPDISLALSYADS